jgi:DNA-binding transcriptional regulator YhcF (GntR family)
MVAKRITPTSTQSSDRYKQMWMHERNRRIEVEQENIRLRKIVYNTKFSINERAIALEVIEQVKEARHVDEQGRKLFSQKDAAEKLGLSRNTIGTAVDILTESGFIKDKETSTLRDKEGKIVKGKDGRPITTIHLDIQQDLYEDFSQVERLVPRKIKDNRKQPVFQCQKCLTEDVTIETSRHLVCRNPNCKACGERVLIDIDYKDQQSEEPTEEPTEETTYSAQNLGTIELLDNSAQNLGTIELLDNSAQNLGTIETEDDSNKHTHTPSAALDHDSIIKEWLNARRGSAHIIRATGKLDPRGKYVYEDNGYQPDLDAFIAGDKDHIYGSRLLIADTEETNVLCFEIDKAEQDAQTENYLLDLSREGASAVYWQRYANERQRGHLEIYFDQAVNAERARQWAIEVCPDLEEIPECYPCQIPEDKRKQGLSWPMYQRIGNQVYPCQAKYMLPSPHEGGLQECDPTNKEALARLIRLAVTPATLVRDFAFVLDEREALQPREQEQASASVCFIGISPKPITQVQSERDLAPQVIAEQNDLHSWDEIAAICGGWQKGFFKAVWRDERTASVRPDKDENLACDYGNHGMFPKKLDRYEAYCLAKGIDKKADLAERIAELRSQQSQVVESSASGAVMEEPATELFPTEHKPVYYTPCIICSKPKNVKRADGVYVCGTEH